MDASSKLGASLDRATMLTLVPDPLCWQTCRSESCILGSCEIKAGMLLSIRLIVLCCMLLVPVASLCRTHKCTSGDYRKLTVLVHLPLDTSSGLPFVL